MAEAERIETNPTMWTSLTDGSAALRNRFIDVVGVWAIYCLGPHFLISTGCSAIGINSENIGRGIEGRDPKILTALAAIALVWVFFHMLAISMLIIIASASARGQSTNLGGTIAIAVRRVAPLTGTLILVCFSNLVATALFILPGIYVGARLCFAMASTCLDDLPPNKAMVRSWAITKGRWWKISKVVYLVALIAFAASMARLKFIDPLIATTIGSHGSLGGALAGISINTIKLLIYAWTTACITTYYVRLSREG